MLDQLAIAGHSSISCMMLHGFAHIWGGDDARIRLTYCTTVHIVLIWPHGQCIKKFMRVAKHFECKIA